MKQLSHSQLGEWPNPDDHNAPGCQLKWAYNKVWKVPQGPNEAGILGDAFHAALEADGIQKMNGSKDAPFTYLFQIARARLDDQLAERDPQGLLRDRRNNMLARLEAMLTCYVRHVQRFYTPSQSPETSFDLMIDGVRFIGKIDAKGKHIIDWKQTKELINKWGKEWIDNAEHADQATAYMIADPSAEAVQFIVFACHPDNPTVCDLRKYTVTRDQTREKRYKRRVVTVAAQMDQAIKDERFDAHISPLCAWCSFIGVCNAGQAAMAAQGRAIAVPKIPHTAACECGSIAEAERHTFADDRAGERVATVVFLCKDCGSQFCRDVRRGGSHAKAKTSAAAD